jgi:hypothetical protein
VSEHRESSITGPGARPAPGAQAAIAARGVGRGFDGTLRFDARATGRAALRAQLERLRPRPLKVQSVRAGRS